MVHVPDGGSDRLVDLTDRYGEAIEADFLRFYGRELSEYLTGDRPVRQAVRLVMMLPPQSATKTQMAVDPRNRPTTSRRRREDAWVDSYHRQSKDVGMDLWELEAAKAASGAKGRKRAPRYPDPTRKKK